MATMTTTGGTMFDYLDDGRVKITNADGSAISVPMECLAKFVHHAYVMPGRRIRDEQRDWRDALLG